METEFEALHAKLAEEVTKNELAGQLGLDLLQQNQVLTKENTELRAQNEPLLEELHALKLRLKVKSDLETEYNNELDALNAKLMQSHKEGYEKAKLDIQPSLDRVNSKNRYLEEELKDKCKEVEKTMEKCSSMEMDLVLKNKQLSLADASGSDGLLGDATIIMHQKDELSNELDKIKIVVSQMKTELQESSEQMHSLKELCQEYKESYEQSKINAKECEEKCLEMKCELESLRSASSSSPAKLRGNSMFAELNDQRLKVETELVNCKRRNDQYKMDIDKLIKDNDNLKYQLVTALKLSAGRGSGQDYGTLKRELDRVRADNRVLKGKVDSQGRVASRLSRASTSSVHKNAQQPSTIADKHLMEELENLRSECEKLRAKNLLTSDDAIEQEKARIEAETKAELLNNEILRLKMRFGVEKSKPEVKPLKFSPSQRHIPNANKRVVGKRETIVLTRNNEDNTQPQDTINTANQALIQPTSANNIDKPVINSNREPLPKKQRVCKRYAADDTSRWIDSKPMFDDLDD